MEDSTMNTPTAPSGFLTRLKERLRELAWYLLDLHQRLFDPIDPSRLPDYRSELQPDQTKREKPRT